ncbi:uncharacterized protein LOC141716687 isoform X2 [Apium graveolens]|uniref:uncharacterized protein LOC141661847 isoform X2 n=1 Tax=Apium graveolens TaxID=4045 RepID=UPI003D790916
MSLFIDLVETFDFTTLTRKQYSEKIDALLNRFPRFKKDCRYRTVLPQKLAKSADDYISIRLCTKGRVPIHGIYAKMDLNLVAVCVQGIVFALDSTDFHASFVPDLVFRKVYLGIQHTPLAVTRTVSYTKETMCCAISTLSLGYSPQKKFQWCNAIVLLAGITSQAARFTEMKRHIEHGINVVIFGRGGFYPESALLGIFSRWNKISKAVRRGECPYIFTSYIQNGRSTEPCPRTVSEESSGWMTLSLINDKDRAKREKLKRVKNEWDEKRKRKRIKRKREEKRKRKHDIRILKKDYNMNFLMKMTNNKRLWESIKVSHGFWYGSVDTSQYEVFSAKCLLRPTQIARDDKHLVSALPPLYRLKVVLQVQTSRAFNFPVVKNIWNGRLLAFSREVRLFVQLGCGRVAGANGATCLPLQFITTRTQTQHFRGNARYYEILEFFRTTFQHQGLTAVGMKAKGLLIKI